MATEKWISGSGVGLTWGAAINSSDMTSMPSSYAVMSTVGDVTNGTALDIFADVSISLATAVVAAPNYLGIYLYPLNQDGTTYGDGLLTAGTQSSLPLSPSYYAGSIVVPTSPSSNIYGMLQRVVMPPGTFRWAIQNNCGVTLSSSTNTVKYRTYNRSVV